MAKLSCATNFLWWWRLIHLIRKLWAQVVLHWGSCRRVWKRKFGIITIALRARSLFACCGRFDNLNCAIKLSSGDFTNLLYLFLHVNVHFGASVGNVALDFSWFLAHVINVLYERVHNAPHESRPAIRCRFRLAFFNQLFLSDQLVNFLKKLWGGSRSASLHQVDVGAKYFMIIFKSNLQSCRLYWQLDRPKLLFLSQGTCDRKPSPMWEKKFLRKLSAQLREAQIWL